MSVIPEPHFEKQAQTADRALDILQKYAPEKTGMLSSLAGKPLIDKALFETAVQNQERYVETAHQIVDLDKQVAEKTAAVQKLKDQMEALVPWLGLPVPVSFRGTRKTAVLIGTISGTISQEEVYGMIGRFAPEIEALDVEIISADRDFTYLAVICLSKEAQTVEDALRAGGFAKPAQAVDKVPTLYREELQSQAEMLQKEIRALQQEIGGFSDSRQDLRLVSDYYRMRAEKYEVLGKLPDNQYLCIERLCTDKGWGADTP